MKKTNIAWLISVIFLGGVAFVLFILYCLIFCVDDWVARYEGHVKNGDTCFKSYYPEKGPVYRIENGRVCMEFKRSATKSYTKTLEGADAETFKRIRTRYFIDKNYVYYGSEVIEGVNPNNFEEVGELDGYFSDGQDVYYKGKKVEGE